MPKTGEKSDTYVAPDIAEGLGARVGVVADVIGSRKDAAAAAGVTVGSLQRYIAGVNIPAFDVCAKLCAAAKVRMEWLAFATPPRHVPEAYLDSQPARRGVGDMDPGMLATAIRIADEVLKKFGLRDQLSSDQFADLTRLAYNDLTRGAAEDAAVASLNRILAINRKP